MGEEENKDTKEGTVYILRLAGGNPDVTEYLIGTATGSEKPGTELCDVIRALCRLVPVEVLGNNAQGQPVKGVQLQKKWDFLTDDYFTDEPGLIHRSAIVMSREVGEDEEIFTRYNEAIEQYASQKAEAEAARIAQEKATEIKENRASRRAKGKVKPAPEAAH